MLNKVFKKGIKKGTIVLLHGNSSSVSNFIPIINSDCEYSLLAFDFFGHGKSTWLDSNYIYDIEFYKNQAISIINEIDDEIFVFGHSLGGHIAIEIAENIKNLKAIAIAGAPPLKKPLNFSEAFMPISEIGVLFTDYVPDNELNALIELFVKNVEVREIVKNDYLKTDPKVRIDLAKVLQDENSIQDEVKILSNLKCEKYIIHTEFEKAVNLNYLKGLKSSIGFELIEFPESGHYLGLENPNKFKEILEIIAIKSFG